MELAANQKKGLIKKIGNIAFWVIIGIVLIFSIVKLTSNKQDQVTSIFGRTGLVVLTDSMSGTFEQGDIIWVDTIDYDTFEFSTLEVGDVITFSQEVTIDGKSVTILNSHRIVNIIEDINGYYHFYTKGDNKPADVEPVSESGVIGIWTGKVWGGAGNFVDFLLGTWGFFIFIVLPCFGFLVYEIFRFVKIVSEYNVSKAVGDQGKIKEEALALARAQIEAEIKAKAEAEAQNK